MAVGWKALRRAAVVMCAALSAFCQSVSQTGVVTGSGYAVPAPLTLAPGQVITLFVTGDDSTRNLRGSATPGQDLPTSLLGYSVGLWRSPAHTVLAPILAIRQAGQCGDPVAQLIWCATQLQITVQIPYGVCLDVAACGASLAVSNGTTNYPQIDVYIVEDSIHLLRSYDTLVTSNPTDDYPCWSGGTLSPEHLAGLPCPPIVTHADGSLVRADHPARPGEVLVAYAVGLGATVPNVPAGKIVTTSTPTATKLALDFNYRPNALATKARPLGTAGSTSTPPIYSGLVAGYAGLYQINFAVPPAPDDLAPCGIYTNFDQNGIFSNLTVSVGGVDSYDGVGICVAKP